MTAPTSAPCGWVLDACGCGGGCLDKTSPDTAATAKDLAAMVMWAATGRRYGLCELTVLPVNPGCSEPLYQTFGLDRGGYSSGSGLATPVLEAGQWSNRCGGGCTCRGDCGVYLDGPVASVVEVLVDGVEVDPALYEVHDRTLLIRVDGVCWPTCQTLGVDIPGFEVTYLRGTPVPAGVLTAAGQLACEYASLCRSGECRLPARMQSLSRQGVDVTVLQNPTDRGFIRTGLPLVDAVIEADNPYGLTERPRVLSPDLPTARRVTWRSGP